MNCPFRENILRTHDATPPHLDVFLRLASSDDLLGLLKVLCESLHLGCSACFRSWGAAAHLGTMVCFLCLRCLADVSPPRLFLKKVTLEALRRL